MGDKTKSNKKLWLEAQERLFDQFFSESIKQQSNKDHRPPKPDDHKTPCPDCKYYVARGKNIGSCIAGASCIHMADDLFEHKGDG